MKKNLGATDRWIRIILGIVLLAILLFVQIGWRWVGLLGYVSLAIGLMNFCPLYALFGISTRHADPKV